MNPNMMYGILFQIGFTVCLLMGMWYLIEQSTSEENPNSDNDAYKTNINKQQMTKENPKSGNDANEIDVNVKVISEENPNLDNDTNRYH